MVGGRNAWYVRWHAGPIFGVTVHHGVNLSKTSERPEGMAGLKRLACRRWLRVLAYVSRRSLARKSLMECSAAPRGSISISFSQRPISTGAPEYGTARAMRRFGVARMQLQCKPPRRRFPAPRGADSMVDRCPVLLRWYLGQPPLRQLSAGIAPSLAGPEPGARREERLVVRRRSVLAVKPRATRCSSMALGLCCWRVAGPGSRVAILPSYKST